MLELILVIAAILMIVSLARLGALFGVFYELTSALLLFLAMIITLRYWYEAARWVESMLPGAGAYGAFGTYWAMFLVGCLPLIAVLNHVEAQSVPRYPKYIDMALGVVFGFIAATILICCVFTSLSVVTPKIWEPYNRDALAIHFDRFPIEVYQHIEQGWLGVDKTDPGHTRFPTFEKADADNFQKYWR
jgi:uncharacterized membrane protein required for colicin V production